MKSLTTLVHRYIDIVANFELKKMKVLGCYIGFYSYKANTSTRIYFIVLKISGQKMSVTLHRLCTI